MEAKLTNFDVDSELYIWECETDYGHITEEEADDLMARFLRSTGFGGRDDEKLNS